jgi:hypothetical protein
MWDWLQGLSGGAPSFIGAVAGSAIGLIALVVGALFNARLNRKRDDRLRAQETRALAAALKAELVAKSRSASDNATRLRERNEPIETDFAVPDIAQSIKVLPKVSDRLGLLDVETIAAVIDAYAVIERFGDLVMLEGGRALEGLPANRRMILVSGDRARRVQGGYLGVSDVIQRAITRLEAYGV